MAVAGGFARAAWKRILCTCLALALLPSVGCIVQQQQPTKADRRLLFRARSVGRYLDGVDLGRGRATLTKRLVPGGVTQLAYLFEDAVTGVRISSTLAMTRSESAAHEIFSAEVRDLTAASPPRAAAALSELSHDIRWDRQARLFLVSAGDRPVGNVFVASRAKISLRLDLSGVYFDDGELFRRFARTKLRRLRRYEDQL